MERLEKMRRQGVALGDSRCVVVMHRHNTEVVKSQGPKGLSQNGRVPLRLVHFSRELQKTEK